MDAGREATVILAHADPRLPAEPTLMGRRGPTARLGRETRLDLYLTEAQSRSLKALSTATGRSRTDLAREAIEAFLHLAGFKSNINNRNERSHQDHE